MADELNFLKHIQAIPADRVARLAYADWLEEQGDKLSLLKADYLRTDDDLHELPETEQKQRKALIRKLRELAKQLSVEFKATVARVPLEHLPTLAWDFRCPLKWENLQPTDSGDVRYCDSCQQRVVFCSTIKDAQNQAARGICVAVDLQVRRRPGDLEPLQEYITMGFVLPTEDWQVQEYLPPPEAYEENPIPRLSELGSENA